jgi:origin recognition complex subunit 2
MPAAGPSRPVKRARKDTSRHSPDEADGDGEEASASHLVSFLTGYNDQHHSDDGNASSDEDKLDGSEDEFENDVDDDEDPDEEATPTKRAKTGLIGTSTPRSARSTPSKSRKNTPRKAATPSQLPKEGDPGFVRPTKADAYFFSTSRSSRTSGSSYSALVKPLSQAQYERYAAKARGMGKSKKVVQDLEDDYARRFDQWEAELDAGFGLLHYGFGSKRRVLNRFTTERLANRGHCVVVNGHFPGTSIRDVLGQIEDMLGIPQDIVVPASAITPLEKLAHRIYGYFLPSTSVKPSLRKLWSASNVTLYLVVHNIDAPGLRTSRSMGILSLLASCPNIHLVASFDHLHTPLLFSTTLTHTSKHEYAEGEYSGTPLTSRGFNWLYHNTTTYDDYDLELSYQRLSASSSLGGITSSHSGGISEEGALQILKSVPPMALRLLKLLLTKQIGSLPPEASAHTAHPAAPVAPVFAVDNDTLQRLSKEKFIAREEERYNALMGEFKDHGLVVEAPVDGEGRSGRYVWVPMGKAALERVLGTMQEVDV